MFEKVRIRAALDRACTSLAREAPVDRAVVRDFTDVVIDIAVKDMALLRLSGDQAAAALVINATNGLREVGALWKLFEKEYDYYKNIYWIYCYFYNMINSRSDYFSRAKVLIDHRTFREMNGYFAQVH